MKLTKKVEAGILKVYQAFWDSYLGGDIKTMGSFLPDDFTLIGTSDGEVFNNKKSAMKHLKATIHQVAGVLTRKNIEIKITQVDDTILVNEFFDAYINADGVPAFYDKFRATTVMKRFRGKWMIIHQHGSLPDSKAEVGETLAAEKVKKENRELRDAVKRRTKELEQKNRDLEIEASLEKVRARAMAMQSSSELADLIGMIYTELTRLDVTLDRCFIMLFDEPTGDATWWMGSAETSSLKRGYHLPFHKHRPHLAYLKGWKNQDFNWRYVLKGDVKKKWDEHNFSKTELAQLPREVIKNMKAWKAVHLSACFNKYGCITSGTFAPLETTSLNLLGRFSRMFEQTYTRFLDLKKAEAQTREAQIELSLERVRARAMAMRSSTELGALIGMIYTELERLDNNLNRCFIVLFDDPGNSTWWMASTESTTLNRGYYVPYSEHPFNLACLEGWRSQDTAWRYVLKGKGKKSWDAYIFGKTEMALVPQFIIDNMRAFPTAYLEAAFNKYGCVMAGATLSPIPLLSFDLIVKFSRTFEQTYTRFLDLQKAEAQARESQIQLALERVRARTMAMQHSDELQDAANVLFKQVQSLEIPVWSCGYNIWERHEKVCTGWMSTNDVIQPPFKIPLTESPTFIRFYKSRKKNEDFYVEKVEGKALAAHYKYMLSLPDFARIVEKRLRAGFKLPKSQINHVANFAHGNLVFITSEPVPDAWDIFKRFAQVFEQTYTRFLDLKRAEAQAREAQLEVALERIRSRSLAMHHSNEITDVIGIVFRQLSELKVLHGTVGIQLFDFDTKDSVFWPGNTLQSPAPKVMFPFDEKMMHEDTCLRDTWQAMSTGKAIFNRVYTKKQKDRYFKYVFANNNLDVIFEESRKIILQVESLTLCFIPEKNSALYADSWDGSVYTEEELSVLKRTAKVFEQAYIRFLDLQRAEAQAREAQIETALEKVRSRSMAMQKSIELREVVATVFQQMQKLGFDIKLCNILLFDPVTLDVDYWLSFHEQEILPESYHVPYLDHTFYEYQLNAWRNQTTFEAFELSGVVKATWDEYLVYHTDLRKLSASIKKIIPKLEKVVLSSVATRNGLLQTATVEPLADESISILQRFAKVFDQSYTRFLDLQNAEAQAREAQIEAALEKVRSSAMAMYRSDELEKVVTALFDKLLELGLSFDGALIYNFDKEKRNIQLWVASKLLSVPVKVNLPHDNEIAKNPIIEDLWRAIEKGGHVLNKSYTGKIKDDYFRYVARNNENNVAQVVRDLQLRSESYIISFAAEKNSVVGFDSWTGQTTTDQDFQVLRRFAAVFEQAYTRFLDLQRAEAQAREAQIQLALERVRARTMAMYVSSDLAQISALLFDQLKQLGVSMWISGFSICKEDSVIVEKWMTRPDGGIMDTLFIPYSDDPDEALCYEIWKSGVELHTYVVGREEIEKGHEHYHNTPSMKIIVERLEELGLELPHWGKIHIMAFKHGYLSIVTTAPFEETQIFVRFAKVFEQTYTRFLDLKNAEGLARESQIQLALERVRARTMAMQKSDELKEVAMLLFRQVTDLGITCWTTGFNVWNEDGNSYLDYVTNPQGEFMEPYTVDTTRFAVIRDVSAARRKGETFYVGFETGERQEETYRHLQGFGDEDQYEKILESGFKFPSQQVNHFVFGEKVSLLFVTYDHVPEAHDIFKRFGKAFEQTYTRFLDLQKAEAQARESQIQLALERVRARTMAMQKSEELNDVAILLFQQVSQLGIKTWTTGFNVWSEDNNSYTDYITSPQGNSIDAYKIDATEFSAFVDVANARKSGVEFWISYLDGELLKETYRRLTNFGGEKQYEKMLEDGFQFPSHQYNQFVFGSKVSLMFITYEPVPEAHDIFKRFGKVFEQTYTRFLDLKKAEAQAREAQIEAALEKVRARTMGMQRSDELAEAAVLMFQQIKSFGLESWGCGFNIWEKGAKEFVGWMSDPEGNLLPSFTISLTEHSYFIQFDQSRQKGIDFWVLERSGAELEEFYNYLLHLPGLGAGLKDFTRSGRNVPTSQLDHVVNFSHGNLIFITYEPCPEAHDIFKRFAKVFEQTYTRFLDLQKAEAQAREAQIEAALERVRSRTMAMHKSEELLDVITVVSEQLQYVGIKFGTVSFGKNSDSFDMDFWVAAPDLKLPIKIYAPYSDIPIYNRLKEAYRERRSFFSDTFTADETTVWNQHIIGHNPELFSEKSRAYLTSRPGMTRHAVLLKNVFLFLINYDFVTYSNEDIEIVIRFANVFEQTYTRFLDLQKAEAQAREAQIEAALERLRSRTMAMQRSTELAEVSQLLLQQFLSLGVQAITCAFLFPNEEKKTQSGWTVLPDGTLLPRLLDFPLVGDEVLNERYSSWKEKRPVHRKSLDIEENRRHHQFLSEQVASHISKDIFTQLPDQLTFTNANFAQGYLMIFSTTRLATEEENILVRFARVFEQTYTRFLDLENSEAQAREAEIQLALERVRARTMAMHQSSEVTEVAFIMNEQLEHLGFEYGGCTIIIMNAQSGDMEWWMGGLNEKKFPESFAIRNFDHPVHRAMLEGLTKGEKFKAIPVSGDLKKSYDANLFFDNGFKSLHKSVKDWMLELTSVVFTLAYNKHGALHWGPAALSDEQTIILQRFAAVFEQSYTRFLDLQKAEAQARDAQIETALERIRSRSLAMHHSGELKDVVAVMFEKMKELNVVLGTIAIQLFDENTMNSLFWAGNNLHDEPPKVKLPYDEKVMEEDGYMKDSWEGKKNGENLINKEYTFEQKIRFFDYVFASNDLVTIPEADRDIIRQAVVNPPHRYVVCLINEKNSSVFADSWNGEFYSEESIRVLTRAAKVFEQAYVRFLDLQKAEAQARESQIEAALERVRSKAMAMHAARQLSEVVHELRTQMGLLGQKDLDTCVIHLNDESPDAIRAWAALTLPDRKDEIREFNIEVPKRGLTIIEEALEAYAANRQDYVLVIEGEKLRQWTEFGKTALPELYALMQGSSHSYDVQSFWSLADFQGGSLLMVTWAPPNEDSRALLRRFANVFGLAYRRFADLKQAEAQAREATIEVSLEKIRSRSLGMHKSEEILDVVAILFGKLKELGLVFDGGAAIHLFSEGSRDATIWVMSPELSRPIVNNLPYDEVVADNPILLDVWKAKDTGQHITNRHYSFEEKKKYFEYVFKHNAHVLSGEVKDFIRSANSYTANFIAEKNSLLGASSWTGQIFSENDIEVLKRVARVFEQAYIRFLDLQRAEAQAREATIEAALERIRSRSLGMHQSEEIRDVVVILFEKLKELGLPFDGGAGFYLFSEGSRDTSMWVTDAEIAPVYNYHPDDQNGFSDNPIMRDVWKAKDTGEPIVNRHYSFEEKNKLFEYVGAHNDETKIPEEKRKDMSQRKSYTATFIPERNSLLSVDSWSKQMLSQNDVDVVKRFARVFEQAYVRFLDLQKAEVHAKEAVCQASLDRVRAEIASMRTVEDLDRITPLIWRELNTIGIPFIRCGVFIMDETNRVLQSFLSTPDGKAIAVFQLPFDVPGRLRGVVTHWLEKKVFLDYWDERAMKDVADILVNQEIFSSSQQYLDTLPKEGFHLHFLPFAQGMLYVGNLTQFKGEELTLLQSLADAFATAYARYDDFNKLESAKQQVDRTLVDLKQAQQQLVQSEKMASLGELTAGIAHEIQNPLNFVNNFSEVSNELIDEMKTELQAGNVQEAADLAESIKQNLEKITHHGKRADGIVKGMLQHSRAGSGQKEPTDLNFLCDEYLRLAYHGYRAKEKSFNARFESAFDSTLPKVNVVAQDIGRVILNLINNAFYAVTEMKRQNVDGYDPVVTVMTKYVSGKVEVRIRDNGIGISEKVKEKIFQPFFTTKPTGQGTGLGLSLSYDIIKAHGGELKVESKEGEGSEFIIRLPVMI